MSTQPLSNSLRKWAEVFMRRSMHDFREFTHQSGLSMSQLSTLMQIHHGGVCGVSDIGEHLGVTNAAASQMVDRLVQQGYLERSEDPKDRRSKNVTLTPKARGLVQESIEARRKWIEELTTALTTTQQEEIIAALNILTQAALELEKKTPADTHAGNNPPDNGPRQ